MKQTIKNILANASVVTALVFTMLGVSSLVALPVAAATAPAEPTCDGSLSLQQGANCSKGTDQQTDLFGDTGVFRTITNVLLFLVGAIAVIMLIIGGIRYTISGGDKSQVESAKNTIMYSIIGIIVVILAYAIVNFVIDNLSKTT